ncbi:G protein-coupled glucose receptor regulating Gpa2-domain-containing protein [Phyllosticta capitalensis]|uniref:G protein-coupled glucose receptor regulating Gpa2-domain-containing protein n=1 Tax=Phyllosticta capitalensis TaxID=121624 RepID=A0ABR1YP91_9PEZI
MGYDSAVNIPTLIGSVLSTFATFTVLVSYLIFSQQKRSFRHALVFNLSLAEFVNSLNNSISGLYIVDHHHDLNKGPTCDANGYIGHLTVQAADFSILAIALVTHFTVIRRTYLPETSIISKVLICASVWVVPLVTSSTAVGLGAIQPIGGNWCWIPKRRIALRYALGDGWRVAIILSTSFIYLYIYVYVRRHFKGIKQLQASLSDPGPSKDSFSRLRSLPFRHPNEPLELELAKPSRAEYRPETCSAIPEVDESFQVVIPNKDRYLAPSSPELFAHADTSSDLTYPRPSVTTARAARGSDDLMMSDLEAGSVSTLRPSASGSPPDTTTSLSLSLHRPTTDDSERPLAPAAAPPSPSLDTTFEYAGMLAPSSIRHKPSQTLTLAESIASSSAAAPPPADVYSPTSIHAYMAMQTSQRNAAVEREVRRMLLLNAYPIMYIALWTPGITSRLAEAALGHQVRWLAVAAASTQYVGLANAVTYGWNEHFRSVVRREWRSVWAKAMKAVGRGRSAKT